MLNDKLGRKPLRGGQLSGWRAVLVVGTLMLLMPLSLRADQPFRQHRYDLFRYLPVDSSDVVFLGNSITDMHNWDEAFVGLPQGVRILNRGVSGALTDDILCHLDDILPGSPRQLFLMIGTNDLGMGRTPRQVADSIEKILTTIRVRTPRTQIFLQSILPSRVGQRTIQDEQEANRLLRALADSLGVQYIDLWPLLGSLPDSADLSFDGLHLTAEGYRRWCQAIAPFIGSDVRTTYPPSTAQLQRWGSLWGSNAMRATYCSQYPIDNADILFFGDEMVKCGEWNELICKSATMHSKIRNRGTGWGYDGTAPSIAITRQLVAATLARGEAEPRAIILYTGTGDANAAQSLDSVEASYAALVADIRSRCPHSPLILLSLMPTSANQGTSSVHPSGSDGRIEAFNAFVRHLADSLDHCRYIDIFTPLSSPDGSADTAYIRDNYLYGRGYRLVADSLRRALSEIDNYDGSCPNSQLGTFCYSETGESLGQNAQKLTEFSRCYSETGESLGQNAQKLTEFSRFNSQLDGSFDYAALLRLQQSRTPQWNRHWVTVSNTFALSALPTAGLFVASRTASDPGGRALLGQDAKEAAVSLLLTAVTTSAVKNIVRRPRPYKQYPDDLRCLQPVAGFSFPSGHTSFSFSAATTLTLLYPKWYVAVPAYLWAASVGFSRLYIGAHYPTDVLAGALTGTTCALIAHWIYNKAPSNDYAPAPQAFTIPVAITF